MASLEAHGKRERLFFFSPLQSLLEDERTSRCSPSLGMLSLALADQRLVPDQRCLHSLTALKTMEESLVSCTLIHIYLVCRTEGYRLKNIVYLMKPRFQIKPFA